VDIAKLVEQHPICGAREHIQLSLPAEIDSLTKLHVVLLLYGCPGTRDSAAGLAHKLGLNEREVTKALVSLQDSGWVTRVDRQEEQDITSEAVWSHVAAKRASLQHLLQGWADQEIRQSVLLSLLQAGSTTRKSQSALLGDPGA
jgi:DNA-binding MarR family transcriptional regulator